MLENNAVLMVEQVSNGFIVKPEPSYMKPVLGKSDVLVFRSMSELCIFMTAHFSHRSKNVISDTRNSDDS